MLANKSLQVVAVETVTAELSAILSQHGLERVFYEPYARVLTQTQIGFPASNTLFVRDAAFVAKRVAGSPTINVLGNRI